MGLQCTKGSESAQAVCVDARPVYSSVMKAVVFEEYSFIGVNEVAEFALHSFQSERQNLLEISKADRRINQSIKLYLYSPYSQITSQITNHREEESKCKFF